MKMKINPLYLCASGTFISMGGIYYSSINNVEIGLLIFSISAFAFMIIGNKLEK
jgi:hypothetical protein